MAEFRIWLLYRKKYGPLNPIRKYDQSGAIVASQINNAHGGKANPIDFMPYFEKPQEDPEKVLAMLLSNPNVKKGR